MMRIAYVCADPGVPVFGRKGASVHVQEVLRVLLGRGARVELFCRRTGGEPDETLRRVGVHELPVPAADDLATRELACLRADGELAAALRSAGPFDLVYERYSLWSRAGMEHAHVTGVPGVLEVNALLVDEQARHRGLVHRTEATAVVTAAARDATVVVAVSEPVAAWVRDITGVTDVLVQPNGVDVTRIRPRVDQRSARTRGRDAAQPESVIASQPVSAGSPAAATAHSATTPATATATATPPATAPATATPPATPPATATPAATATVPPFATLEPASAPAPADTTEPAAATVLAAAPDPAAIAAAPGIAAAAFTVGFVGTLKPWHGIDVLVRAFAEHVDACPDSQLLVVGDGPQRAALTDLALELGVAGSTCFTGAVDPADVPSLLHRMDVAVAPYPDDVDHYFSPLKIYEYLAAGLPVVASRIGQVASVLVHDHDGVLVPPGDAAALAAELTALRADDERRTRLGRVARRTAERHTWSDVVTRTLAAAGVEAERMCHV